MIFLDQYINKFLNDPNPTIIKLGDYLAQTKQAYNTFSKGNAVNAFQVFVDQYNWLGDINNKKTYGINENLARNLPGALMQDYLIHLMLQTLSPYPRLDVFTEVPVEFGTYPVWKNGAVSVRQPKHLIDVTVGYRLDRGENAFIVSDAPWPRPEISSLAKGQFVVPLIGISSKIRVSQGEFFDWLGRDQLLTKGNPHCLSIQVALRTEMNLDIIDICQVKEKFFLLGKGGERNVVSDLSELERLLEVVNKHLEERM